MRAWWMVETYLSFAEDGDGLVMDTTIGIAMLVIKTPEKTWPEITYRSVRSINCTGMVPVCVLT